MGRTGFVWEGLVSGGFGSFRFLVTTILISPFAMAFPLTIRPVNSFHQTTSHLFSDEMPHDRTKKPTKLSTLRHTLKQKRTNNKKAKKQNKNKYHKILHNQIKQTRSEPNLVVNLSNRNRNSCRNWRTCD